MPAEIFYSYAHEDEGLRDELEKHLSILKRSGLVSGWHDRRINAGSVWSLEIDNHINTADIILLLISCDFMASEYCHEIEMKRAMARHEAGEALVIPIVLRPVIWKGALFAKLQALPSGAKPVTTWTNRDEAFTDITEAISSAIESREPASRAAVGSDVPNADVGNVPACPNSLIDTKPAFGSAFRQTLPARRPKVTPSSYGVADRDEGLLLANEGTAAFDVRIEPIDLDGNWNIVFDEVSYLEGRGFSRSLISRGNTLFTTLNGLWPRLQGVSAVHALIVTYKDYAGRHYRSVCELHRDVLKKSGFDVKFIRQERAPEPRSVGPLLLYGQVTDGGNRAFTRGSLRLQLATIRNTQLAIKSVARNVQASIKYIHAGGDHFCVRGALWIVDHLRSHILDLSGNEEQGLVISLQAPDGTLFASLDENYFQRELDVGHWSVEITITADNCKTLLLEGGFTIIPEGDGKRLAYDHPALRVVSGVH